LDFKIDENLPSELARLLIDAGHSALTVLQQGLGGASDREVSKTASGKCSATGDAVRAHRVTTAPGGPLLASGRAKRLKNHKARVSQRSVQWRQA
jgi:hypothetical protein